ncbi:MAG: tetratricopeptide repeat protein, partial [Flavobacteriales bacterium]|nr:tetratricopeptide repeat protein [Flavobacteriales bacterium]
MMKLVIKISLCCLLISTNVLAQQTKIYTDKYSQFKEGMELYDKLQYQAAQKKFNETVEEIENSQDEIRIDAEYYAALCALELFNQDAEYLLNKFVYDHPDNVRTRTVFFNLGTHHYRRKRYRDAIKYFKKVDKYELSQEQRLEYHFKLGYASFRAKDYNTARDNFLEVKDKESEYQVPARYYYAHIAYMNNQNQLALEGFKSIDTDPNFKKIVPYYIGQILYKQKKYKEVSEHGPLHFEGISKQRRSEFAHIIGDSFYRLGMYAEAIPYLKEYNTFERSSREDNYQIGYTYYNLMDYENAIKYLSKVKSKKDSLAQIAFYQLGDAYIQNDQKDYARNAFKAASQLTFDKEIEEEALWSYAKLAYELSYNPYDEAIDAFHQYIETYPSSHRVDEAYEFLLNVYTTTKNYEAALESIARIKNKNEKMKKAYQVIAYNRGVELFHNGSYAASIKSFDDSREYKVDKTLSSGAVYWQAEANFGMGKFKEAIEKYHAFKNEPGAILTGKRALADYNLGYTYLRRDNISASITSFRQYIQGASTEQNERKADAYLRIADNYYLLKEDADAIKNYQNALNMAVRNGDYAYFQMAKSQSYNDDVTGQSASLKSLL